MDCFILSLYHLQIFYCNEIKRGIVGLGEYTIASEYKNIEFQGLENVVYLMALSPEDIVKNNILHNIFWGKCHYYTNWNVY